MKKAVLITGGAGYIGSHTAKVVSRAGLLPVVLDNLSTGNEWAVRWGPLVRGDIADQELVCKTIRQYGIDSAVHFAASAYVGESMRMPREYYENNVVKSLALMNALLNGGVEKLVFSSSCAVYGATRDQLLDETHSTEPISPYGETKRAIEVACRWYAQAYGMRSVCLRYFNAAGADVEGELGESHDPETHLIPRVIGAALGIYPRISIYGSDLPTPDGTAIRDYVHVTDIAKAHVAALYYLDEGKASLRVNLGTGRGHSIREVIAAVKRVSGRTISVREEAGRPGDPPSLVASAAMAERTLGWRPEVTDLDEIVESAWNWSVAQREQTAISASC